MDKVMRIMKSMKPFVLAAVETGGLSSGTMVRKLLTSRLDDLEELGISAFFDGGFERWMISEFIGTEIVKSSMESGRLSVSPANRFTVEKAIDVAGLVLDNFALMPSLDLVKSMDFSLGFCMTFWGLHGNVDLLQSNLDFLLHFAQARNDDWAKVILEEGLEESERNNSNDVAFILVEAEDRTPLLDGIQTAAAFDVHEFADVLEQMNPLRADQLLMLVNHARFNQHPESFE